MERRKAGIKALRVDKRRATHNARVRRDVRLAISSARKAAASGDASAQDALKKAFGKLDRAVKSGVFHANTAARYKSRLAVAAKKASKK